MTAFAPELARYTRTLEACQPWLVVSERTLGGVATDPLGVPVPRRNILSPHDVAAAPFLNLLQRLDELAYGPRGMKMPRWVFYDCAEMVGGLFGLGRPAGELPAWVRDALGVDAKYDGLVPLSLVILIPMLERGAFLCYAHCSINQPAPGAAPAGLRVLTIALALRAFGVRTLYATTQWRSPSLEVHARFGPLDLLTAHTPAHDVHATLTFRTRVTAARLYRALRGAPPHPRGTILIDADDEDVLRGIQREIESGARWRVVGPPRDDGAVVHVPAKRVGT